jgi:SMI1-KNR4 cell-wall
MDPSRDDMTINELMAYIAPLDPPFADSIQGASAAEVRTLATLVGRPLPHAYQEFLSAMGHGTGWIKIGYDTTTDISRVIEFYRDYVKVGKEMLPEDCIAISVFGVDLNVCLDIRSTGEPPVVFTEANQIYKRYADSLGMLLFRLAFFHYMPRRRTETRNFWNPERTYAFERACNLANKLGFRPLPFSDTVAWCGDRPDACIGIRQYEDDGIHVAIGADQESNVMKLGREFERELGVRLER